MNLSIRTRPLDLDLVERAEKGATPQRKTHRNRLFSFRCVLRMIGALFFNYPMIWGGGGGPKMDFCAKRSLRLEHSNQTSKICSPPPSHRNHFSPRRKTRCAQTLRASAV